MGMGVKNAGSGVNSLSESGPALKLVGGWQLGIRVDYVGQCRPERHPVCRRKVISTDKGTYGLTPARERYIYVVRRNENVLGSLVSRRGDCYGEQGGRTCGAP